MRKRTKIIIWAILVILTVFYIVAVLINNGIIWLNNPSEELYPVRGVDVSSYQGLIDWDTIASQDIEFAFIKATEGSGFIDEKFKDNFKRAENAGIRVGAYHFFSFDSSGQTQAENFINTVPKSDNMLPPVLDIELYGDKSKNIPDTQQTRIDLKLMIDMLQEHYGMNPILYVTYRTYSLYVEDEFLNNDIWLRSVTEEAALDNGRDWRFWQYCHKGRLKGYSGPEKYIDLNVFNGTKEEFKEYKG